MEPAGHEAHASGVSWPAVIAGAFVAAALSLILLALGAGLGLSSVSPWSHSGASAPEVGAGAIIWLIVMEIIASAMAGYLAGRLRTKWASIHTDEVYFRDTAHGFLAWAVALVLTAAFLASSLGADQPMLDRERLGRGAREVRQIRMDILWMNFLGQTRMLRTGAIRRFAVKRKGFSSGRWAKEMAHPPTKLIWRNWSLQRLG
jgi:hypothetical protein